MTTPNVPLVVEGIPHVPVELAQIADRVALGERPTITVRLLLAWFFGSKRRGRWIVSIIREALDKLNLQTDPDFDSTYLDGPISFVRKLELKRVSAAATVPIEVRADISVDAVLVRPSSATKVPEKTPIDSTYRIGRLEIANRVPVSVSPEATITQAITIMLRNEYSQLPVT